VGSDPERARRAAEKTSLVRHERFFSRSGELRTEHLSDGREILPHLPAFFDQHVARWAETEHPSPFTQPDERRFIERLTELAAAAGWLRFTRVLWNGRPIAYHYGFLYGGRFHWWRPSFDIDLARHSPGEVLMRQLLLHAIDEQARVFDFGLGVLPFKERFATSIEQTCYWGTNR
jgi:CelD/BcsL family acetyltransferase involved in cellulose biosynthesis